MVGTDSGTWIDNVISIAALPTHQLNRWDGTTSTGHATAITFQPRRSKHSISADAITTEDQNHTRTIGNTAVSS
jgi:hypothetical protein